MEKSVRQESRTTHLSGLEGWRHKKLAAEGAPHVKTVLQRQIEVTDKQIDALVYELYGLTAAEIAVVEGAA